MPCVLLEKEVHRAFCILRKKKKLIIDVSWDKIIEKN